MWHIDVHLNQHLNNNTLNQNQLVKNLRLLTVGSIKFVTT